MKKSNGEEKVLTQKEEYLPTDPIEGEAAYVGVSAGMTYNMGNFNSAKINISITYPCSPEKVDGVYDVLKDWIDKRLHEEIQELKESAGAPRDVEI